MRRTEDLIQALAAEGAPVSRSALETSLSMFFGAGLLVAAMLFLMLAKLRPDLSSAIRGYAFWAKWAFPAGLSFSGLLALASLARPDSDPLRRLWLASIPLLMLAGASAWELGNRSAPPMLVLNWVLCAKVMSLAAPILLLLLVAIRRQAPTHLALAGAAAGLAAGGAGAMLYCFQCSQASWTLILGQYTPAIGLVAALGALCGPRLLRW